ncbi:MAG: CRISPR system precrRNA processing endoribonuclease RAMP protein Cas6 [Chloroflexi bacterium]|nr:CRISPR system precrRNA processing endoribonuclease RAMP protein Cas6 [Chloroflexota bacterium]
MLLSAVIHLKALENGSLPADLGPALRAEFLNWVGDADSGHSDHLHDGDELRPYTISDLKGSFQAQRGFRLIQAGQSAWFRVTSLREKETRLLLDSVFPAIRSRKFTLIRTGFQVQKVAVAAEEHPWARQTAYPSLVEKYFKADPHPAEALDVEFTSPTTFHAGKVHVPLPLPENVLGSWLKRWNACSSASLPREVHRLEEARLVLSRYKLETRAVHYEKATWIGFEGSCRFRVLAEDEFWLRLCNLLTDFAFFCGTGAKTSFGLGQTRRTHEMDRRDSEQG